MEKTLNGQWHPKMLADCPWSIKRETPTGEYKEAKEDEVSVL
jgi:hypothetical protein